MPQRVWKQNVLSNNAVKTFTAGLLKKGKHTLKVYRIDPGVIFDRFVINPGGLVPAYGLIPGSYTTTQ